MAKAKRTIKIHPALLQWKIQFDTFTREILENNSQLSFLVAPFNILRNMMYELGEISGRINDPELTAWCARMAIYEQTDPTSPNFSQKELDDALIAGYELKKKRLASRKKKV